MLLGPISVSQIELPKDPTDEELARHWTLSEMDRRLIGQCRGGDNRRRFALQLCILRKHGRFLTDYEDAPVRISNHLSAQLNLEPLLFMDSTARPATESRYQEQIRDYLGYQPFNLKAQEQIEKWIQEQAAEGMLPTTILGKVEEALRSASIVLPAASTLERLVASLAKEAEQGVFERISARLPLSFCAAIDALLEVPPGDKRSELFQLKVFPPEAKAKYILEYIAKFQQFESLKVRTIDLTGFGAELVRHLANLARDYNAYDMRRFIPPKRYALTTTFLIEAYKTVLDHLVDMHDQYMTTMCRHARHSHEGRLREMRTRAKHGMDRLITAVECAIDHEGEQGSLLQVLSKQIDELDLRTAVADCRAFKRLEERGYLEELESRYAWLRRYLPAFFDLPFQAEPGGGELLSAIEIARDLNTSKIKALPLEVPTKFAPPSLRPFLIGKAGILDRRVWEISLALAVKEGLRSGDLFLPGSRRHVSFWNLVYNEKRWQNERNSAYTTLGLPQASDAVLGRLGVEFDNVAATLEKGLANNPLVTIHDGELRLKRLEAVEIPERVKELRRLIETRLPKIRIERLIEDVDRSSGFSGQLRPLAGYEPRNENLRQVLLATLIAHGTNLGLAGMGQSAEGITTDMLQHASHWFLRESTLKAANAVLVNYHQKMPLASVWGDGTISSSDGQRFSLQRSSLVGAVYPRYFGFYDQAITIYTHTSGQCSVFSTQVISCSAREALYVLDGLLAHDTALRPHAHSTDTHGYTEHIFGLCYLLGFSFMPRIRNLHEQQLYKLDRSKIYGQLEGLFRGTVDTGLIAEQWDQLVRLAASLKNRTAPASVIVRRLANSSPSDRLAKALTALSRVVKTAYILRYVHDKELRRLVQQQLNRGEHRHELARWMFFANLGEFRTGDYEEIMNKASCLSLLSNAVLVWNTAQYSEIIRALRASGHIIDDADLAKISPLLHRHVIPNGTYNFR